MDQLHLNIATRLVYAPQSFVLHAGVKSLYDRCLVTLTEEHFSICCIVGAARRGKTHFSIKLSQGLSEQKLFPRLIEGQQFSEWITDRSLATELDKDQVLIVDDGQDYLAKLKTGDSGEFVNLVESLRVKRAGLVIFSSKELSEFEFDQHIESRLNPGLGYVIGNPDQGEIQELILQMAKQRGILLTEKKASFLVKRVGRDLAAIEKCMNNVDYLSQLLGERIKFDLLADAVSASSRRAV